MKESKFKVDLDELRKLADKQEWMVEKEFLLAVAGELEELREALARNGVATLNKEGNK